MTAPYFQNHHITLHHGDALAVSAALAPASIDCIVTSPPYYGLRDYGQAGQYGLEETPAAYVEALRKVFAGLWDTLTPGGSLWLNLGDIYSTGSTQGVPPKSLLGMPWRVAFALQDDGWILRSDIIWNKTNAMPESVRDRVARRHEHIFMFVKSGKYHFNLDAIREPYAGVSVARAGRARETPYAAPGQTPNKRSETAPNARGKNPGDVWAFGNKPFPGAHFATFPPELPRRCILAGSPAGGTVLDPFHGTGTTGMVALEHGRKYVGIDVSAEYLDLSLETRLKGQKA